MKKLKVPGRFYAAVLLLVSLPSFVSGAVVPLGIPAPLFGLDQTAGTPTHYVNNAHAAATDTNNTKGTASRPRLTIPATLPAGAVVRVSGGPYSLGNLTWTSQGTRSRPAIIVGVGRPLFQGDGASSWIRMSGSYLIVDGIIVDGGKVEAAGTAMVLRNSEIRNVDATAVVITGSGSVIYRNHVHHNGDSENPVERDTHGVFVMPATYSTFVLENDIHHNGGDGIMVGSQSATEPWARYVFIGGNRIYEDRENGIDIKKSRDVVVSQNTVSGYRITSSSAGEAIVTHDTPQRVWILNNSVGYSEQGIVSTGAAGYIVAGNAIINIRHRPSLPYDPNSVWGAAGILTYSTSDSVHVNNTVWGSDAGISFANGTSTIMANNIVGARTEATGDLLFGSESARKASIIANNYSGNPGFVDPNAWDFRLLPGSEVDGQGAAHTLSQAFQALYGVPLNRDLYGATRLYEVRSSIGAAERR
jgi:nitrous oxidase accessory protein NosD